MILAGYHRNHWQGIIGISNDIHLTKFKCILDTNTIIKPQNEILIFNYKDKKIRNILEFRPEEKEIFIKYFNMFFKNNN